MNLPGDSKGAHGLRHEPQSDWRTKAACREYQFTYYDPWESGPKDRYPSQVAASFCKTCPVQRECLLAGLESDRMNAGAAYMTWGGLAPGQRRALVRLRFRQGCPVCHGKLLITPEGEEWQACAQCGITWRCRKRKVYKPDAEDA